MLSRSHRFLFIHIPKTAGNSVQDALRGYSADEFIRLEKHHDGVERFQLRSSEFTAVKKHSTLATFRLHYGGELFGGLFKFTCVRNPWERAVSHYFSPSRQPRALKWDKAAFARFLPEMKSVSRFLSATTDPVQPLADAVRNIDYVMRLETLEADFQAVCGKLGIAAPPLPVRNRSGREDARVYYDAESVKLVYRQFREEIEHFGYSFE